MDDKESIKNEAIDETVENEINLEVLNEKDGEVDSKDSVLKCKFVEQKVLLN